MSDIDNGKHDLMVPALRVIDQTLKRYPTAAGILGHLTSDQFDMVETEVRRMIARFQLPDMIRTVDEFTAHAFRFVIHVQNWPSETSNTRLRPEDAMIMLQRWYKGDLRQAARDAIYNREGGFFEFIDKLSKAILQEQLDAHFAWVFWVYIPVDQEPRIRLAEEFEEFIRKRHPYATDLKKAAIWAGEIEDSLKRFALLLHQERRLSRY